MPFLYRATVICDDCGQSHTYDTKLEHIVHNPDSDHIPRTIDVVHAPELPKGWVWDNYVPEALHCPACAEKEKS